jgi:outer membrane protein
MKQFTVPFITLLLVLLMIIPVKGQELLTLDRAIEIGLENNYGIQISRNFAEIAANNRTLGNAGFLPTISANATRRESVENSRFETQATDGVNENRGARSTNTNAGISLNWTLFDGMNMFINHEKLGEFEQFGREELRLQAEFTVEQIVGAYVNIVRINEQLNVLENSVEVSLERIDIAETKRDLGSGSEYELLQAQTDLNADRAAVLRESNRLVEAKIHLNDILARDAEEDFDVSPDIIINRALQQNELQQNILENNISIQLARTEQRIAELEIREIRSERLPQLELNSGYTYNRNEGGGGFMIFNETDGFNIGLTARINIFDGFNTNRRVQNARINQRNSELMLEEELKRINAGFLRAYRTYQNSIELVDLEEDNLAIAEETLDIALERFRQGMISAIEFREAQRTFLSAESRLIEAKYDAKIAETELLRLSGGLQHIAL